MRTLLALSLLAPLAIAQQPWFQQMDFGPCISLTCEGFTPDNAAYKGRAILLGDDAGVLFDTDLLRVVDAWAGGRLELRGTQYDGQHGIVSRVDGIPAEMTARAPGFAKHGSFDDPRPIPYGPLPRDHARFLGLFFHGDRVVLHYRVGDRDVLETYDALRGKDGKAYGIVRTLRFGPGAAVEAALLDLPAAPADVGRHVDRSGVIGMSWVHEVPSPKQGEAPSKATETTWLRVSDADGAATADIRGQRAELRVKAGKQPRIVRIAFATTAAGAEQPDLGLDGVPAPDFDAWINGGVRRYPQELTTHGELGKGDGPFVVDTITVPDSNPWHSRLRFAAFDFVDDDTAAIATWNGDVWLVHGVDKDLDQLRWTRYCTGLYDPLGLRVQGGRIYTLCRDGIHILNDLDGDGECDEVEVFNSDVYTTKAFHEFAFDLQTDAAGNFYFSKAGPVRPGGRGFEEIVPHHGTVMRVSKDGSKLEVIATGLRAPNGIAVTPDGVVTTGDNQGTWTPACRLNITTNGTFFGCEDTAHRDPAPKTYDPPICFFPMSVDNSSGGQVWIPEDTWGPLGGQLIHQSYGQSADYLVLRQVQDGITEGGVVRLPCQFDSSQMRGRFHDGDLYVSGFKGWQTNAVKETAFQRVRRTDAPLHLPIGMRVCQKGVELTFSDPLDAETAGDPESYGMQIWNYAWTEAYGSPEFKPSDPEKRVEEGVENRDTLKITAAKLAPDGRTVFLSVDGMQKVMQTRITYSVDAKDGAIVEGEIFGTIHFLPKTLEASH